MVPALPPARINDFEKTDGFQMLVSNQRGILAEPVESTGVHVVHLSEE
jgi:hypothetical protein